MITTFDTHQFYTRFKEAGFSELQADTLVKIHRETVVEAIEQVKHDFKLDDVTTNNTLDARVKETELKIELVRKEIEVLRAESKKDIECVRKEIAESKAELSRTILNVGVGVGLTQVFSAFILLLRMTGKI